VSGRALGQSAARSARRVVVLDAFGDADTRAVGPVFDVGLRHGIGLDGKRMLGALARATSAGEATIVTGSGFERHPQWLDRVALRGRLHANPARLVAALKDPAIAFELLGALGWPAPETRTTVPEIRIGWLQKRIGGAGGIHVRRATGARHAANAFYQREITGTPMSVTFLADGERAHVLGYNRLLTVAIGRAPFCHAGAISGAILPGSLRTALQTRLDRLVRVTALRGLNGIDFLWQDDRAVAVEINPRPTASFELYDPDFEGGLVHWHVRSFGERLADVPAAQAPPFSRGHQVVYADRTITIPREASWPAWCHDLPRPESVVRAGTPALTVSASGPTIAAVQLALENRVTLIRQQLDRWLAQPAVTSEGILP
jgi:uncharacterized protein